MQIVPVKKSANIPKLITRTHFIHPGQENSDAAQAPKEPRVYRNERNVINAAPKVLRVLLV